MARYFNIAGPCNSTDHYMVPVLKRNKDVMPLIEQKHYFVIHAARQTGKTTLIKSLVNQLNVESKYYALYCSLEAAHVFAEPDKGIPEVLNLLAFAVKYSNLPHREGFAAKADKKEISTLIKAALSDYCSELDKPLVIFFDEIDGLQNGTLVTFLRQLRDGYINRPEIPFPHSVALVGMRNIRDYKSKIREDRDTLGSPSPFNIITKALTIRNFSLDEITDLYQQHTTATGQIFEKEALQLVNNYTDGQPWLVNAIAREIVTEILENDFSKNVTAPLVEQAAQNIMLRRDTHLDSLLDKLKEERVRKVIEPVITGQPAENILSDDTQYCLDLGLIKIGDKGLEPANKMYAEVIVRTLTYDLQFSLERQVKNRWVTADGRLDMNGIMEAFQQFWRTNSAIWKEKYQYKEAAPQLILQAFLQRIINGGGDMLREFATGTGRTDLCARYGPHQYPIEIKILYGKQTVPEGLTQLANYMDTLGESTGWLVVFDRDNDKAWEEKISWNTDRSTGKTIHIVGA